MPNFSTFEKVVVKNKPEIFKQLGNLTRLIQQNLSSIIKKMEPGKGLEPLVIPHYK